MKITYTEQIENRTAFSRKMYCSKCGSHEYEVVEQLEPQTLTPWYVRCAQCDCEAFPAPARDIAIARWKQLTYQSNPIETYSGAFEKC